ncbi:hypothetical protein QYE76_018386 [Lolium multiflorum]|uniref:Uncharacterized protein n=1 Tax=Lolium multiflorum TaxID=4521 RepID=A0AAD8QEG2_LOLMU|nr:hypothetical protein QYE76_018386 [Lolium multiflorum]
MSQHDGGHAGVYPEYEDDRQAELVGDSDYEDDEYIQSVCTPVKKGQLYYEFKHNTRSVKPTILHLQNVVRSSSTDTIVGLEAAANCSSSGTKPLDLEPTLKCHAKAQDPPILEEDETPEPELQRRRAAPSAKDSGSAAVQASLLLTSTKHLHLHMSLSPDGKIIAVVGDDPAGLLVDANTGKMIHELRGHFDYSFASAWNPDGRTFATGNQDKTCRIWDARNLSKSVAVLRGNIGAIRSIRYTSDGKFLAMAEPADFIHIFDVESGYNRKQELDFFGEIAGMSFSPDTEVLFVGVHDANYSSLLQFGRRQCYSYLDSAI